MQNQAKKEIESEISSGIIQDGLAAITINKSDNSEIVWTESEKEMQYKGNLYDVVKSTETETTITFYCIDDKKETTLFANLDNHIQTNVIANKPVSNSKKMVEQVVKLYFPTISTTNFTALSSNRIFSSSTIIYTSTLIEKNAPPPEFI